MLKKILLCYALLPLLASQRSHYKLSMKRSGRMVESLCWNAFDLKWQTTILLWVKPENQKLRCWEQMQFYSMGNADNFQHSSGYEHLQHDKRFLSLIWGLGLLRIPWCYIEDWKSTNDDIRKVKDHLLKRCGGKDDFYGASWSLTTVGLGCMPFPCFQPILTFQTVSTPVILKR